MARPKRVRHGRPPKPPRAVEEFDPNTCYIFTDGASSRLKGSGITLGGWGAVLLYRHHIKEISGCEAHTTNNAMELRGIYEGLKLIKPGRDTKVIVFSDSQYAINCIVAWAHSWAKRDWMTSTGTPVANRELIQAILPLVEPRIRFRWVKGHNEHPYNEQADGLAVEARQILKAMHMKLELDTIPDKDKSGRYAVKKAEDGTVHLACSTTGEVWQSFTPDEARKLGFAFTRNGAEITREFMDTVPLYPPMLQEAIDKSKAKQREMIAEERAKREAVAAPPVRVRQRPGAVVVTPPVVNPGAATVRVRVRRTETV